MKKVLFWSIFLIITAVFAGQFFVSNVSRLYERVTIEHADQKTVKIVLVGDIVLDRGIQYMIEKQGNGDFKFPFLKIADELNRADIIFGNLEGPISDKGTKVGSIYSFRNDPEAIEGLTFAGFNVISLANNHAFDYSKAALEDCLTRFAAAGIAYAGAGFSENEAFSPAIKDIDGTKIGFLAYTNLGPKSWRANGENSGIAWIDDSAFDSIKHNIEEAKKLADVLIVSLHAGEEYEKTPTQFQLNFEQIAVEAGADIVVNHHPHIVQPDLYSLGNFVFDQGFSEETMEGQIVEILIQDKKIKEIQRIDIEINEFFQPEINP
ncbi:MAG: CapA family protein [Candidatus Nealsonbacteria bacterium]